MESIQRVSGRQAPAQVPDWVITSYDVEIEKNRKLGTGGFGVVSRGTWNGTVVAVKQLMQETNQDVCLLILSSWHSCSPLLLLALTKGDPHLGKASARKHILKRTKVAS